MFPFLQDGRSYEGEYVNDQKDGEANSTHHNFDVTCTRNRFRRFCCLCSFLFQQSLLSWQNLSASDFNESSSMFQNVFWISFQKCAESGHFSMARWTCAQLHHLPVPNCGNVSSSQPLDDLDVPVHVNMFKIGSGDCAVFMLVPYGVSCSLYSRCPLHPFAVHTISCKIIFIS